ncbi:MAG TPA: ribose-5-phosphate isomerase RpiA [Longimicrobiaceae bacterium]
MHERDGEELKRQAALQAAERIRDGMVVGLGTGSTVRHLLEAIAERRSAGELTTLHCIPTSRDTAARATRLGLPLASLATHPVVDLTIDGADEVDPELNLIKGMGGALLREKIVAAASRTRLIIVDGSKVVRLLGTRSALPVEVDPFGAAIQPPFLRALGAEPALRTNAAGEPYLTDGGNHIYDCRFPDGIDDPAALECALNNRPGVIENGLFVGLADEVIIADGNGTRSIERAAGKA